MQDLPHHYQVNANAESSGNVALKADDLPQLITAPPAELHAHYLPILTWTRR